MVTSASSLRNVERPRHSHWTWAALIALCVIGAVAVVGRILQLQAPPQQSPAQMTAINALFAQAKWLTLVHVVTALLFVALVPFYFMRRVHALHPRLHSRIERMLLSLGIVLGVTALIMSVRIPIAGVNGASATILYGCFFLFSLGRAVWLGRNGRPALHDEWMIRAVGIALGVATTRPIMGLFFATSRLTHLTPHDFFGTAFWIGFSLTYIATEAWLRHRRDTPGLAS